MNPVELIPDAVRPLEPTIAGVRGAPFESFHSEANVMVTMSLPAPMLPPFDAMTRMRIARSVLVEPTMNPTLATLFATTGAPMTGVPRCGSVDGLELPLKSCVQTVLYCAAVRFRVLRTEMS